MATKPRLSRQYVYAPFNELNFPLQDATVHRVAFMNDWTAEPEESDWLNAITVTQGHSLFHASIGNSLSILVGPDRGDSVDTEDLAVGEYLMWSDIRVPGSDERLVDWHGPVVVIDAPGGFS